ncbi:MAG: hypothetical protein WCF90_04115 [Methanomicrobiales archaeon]
MKLTVDTDSADFVVDPIDYKVGTILNGIGVILHIILFMKRTELDLYLTSISEIQNPPIRKSKKKKIIKVNFFFTRCSISATISENL